MEKSLKTGFAQIFSCCPKNLRCPNFGGGSSPSRPPGPYAYAVSFMQERKGDSFLISVLADTALAEIFL